MYVCMYVCMCCIYRQTRHDKTRQASQKTRQATSERRWWLCNEVQRVAWRRLGRVESYGRQHQHIGSSDVDEASWQMVWFGKRLGQKVKSTDKRRPEKDGGGERKLGRSKLLARGVAGKGRLPSSFSSRTAREGQSGRSSSCGSSVPAGQGHHRVSTNLKVH